MLLLVLIFVLVAFGLLLVALVTSTALWAWISVVVSVAAAGALVVDALRRRAAVKSSASRDIHEQQYAPPVQPSTIAEPPTTAIPVLGDAARLEPATEVFPALRGGASGGGPRRPEAPAGAPRSDSPAGPSGVDAPETVAIPVVSAPSGSAERPSGAQPDGGRVGDERSPSVTADQGDRSKSSTFASADRSGDGASQSKTDAATDGPAGDRPTSDRPVSDRPGGDRTGLAAAAGGAALAAGAAAAASRSGEKRGSSDEDVWRPRTDAAASSGGSGESARTTASGGPGERPSIPGERPSTPGDARQRPPGSSEPSRPAAQAGQSGRPSGRTEDADGRWASEQWSRDLPKRPGQPGDAAATTRLGAVPPAAPPPPGARTAGSGAESGGPARPETDRKAEPARPAAESGRPTADAGRPTTESGRPAATADPSSERTSVVPPVAAAGAAAAGAAGLAAAAGHKSGESGVAEREQQSGSAAAPAGQSTEPPADTERAPSVDDGAAATQAIAPVPPAEPGEERPDSTEASLVAALSDEVVVVDEQPRYHLIGCRELAGSETIPLPVKEAVEYGFTPCSGCTPVHTLATRNRAASSS